MNTRLGKSFGLAFVMAVGILAVMFALGTFSAPKAGAAVTGVALVLSPDTPETDVTATITFTESEARTSSRGNPVGWNFTFSAGVNVSGAALSTTSITATKTDGNPASLGVVTALPDPDVPGVVVNLMEGENLAVGDIVIVIGGLVTPAAASWPVVVSLGTETASVPLLELEPNTLGTEEAVMATITYRPGVVTVANSTLEFEFSEGLDFGGVVTATVEGESNEDPPADPTDPTAANVAPPVSLTTVGGGGVAVTSRTVTITLPADFDAYITDPAENPAAPDHGFKAEQLIVTITSGITKAASGTATVIVGGETSNVVLLAEPVEPEPEPEESTDVKLEVSPQTAGAAARVIITIDATDATLGKIGEIVVDMDDFGLPSTFDTDDVSLRGLDDGLRGAPEDVEISGSEVTITVDDMDQSDADTDAGFDALSRHFRIIFDRSAGITVPTTAGNYTVTLLKLTEEDAVTFIEPKTKSDAITVDESLSIDPDDGPIGTEVTVTGKGFDNDITSLFVDKDNDGNPDNDEHEIATNLDVDDGTFSYTFTIDSNFEKTSHINVRKTNGVPYRMGAHAADTDDVDDQDYPTFTITGSISLSTDSAQPGEEINVSWDGFGDGTASAKIGGEDLFGGERTKYEAMSTDGSDDIDVTIPVGLTVGKHQVKVSIDVGEDDPETGTADITIGGLPLRVNPDTAVPGQEITIRGSGFTGGENLATVMVGGKPVEEQANGQDIEDLIINNAGTFVLSVDIPKNVTDEGSDVLVEVVESGNGRSGVTKMTIPKPTLSLSPAESRMDTTVVASGTGFGASDNVSIVYAKGGEDSTTSVTADSTGNWTKAFTVPLFAGVGSENMVTASGSSDAGKSASTEHMTPGAAIEVSPESGRPGITVTITGIDFQAYSSVTEVTIGGLTIPSSGVNTDKDGNFTMTGLLPGLAVGTQSLVVIVGSGENINRDSVVFTVGEAGPATLPSADAFDDLITSDNLIVVWNFDNTTKAWSFYDPRPAFAAAIDLTEVTSGDNVWIQLTADQMFQSGMLTAGWNLVTID